MSPPTACRTFSLIDTQARSTNWSCALEVFYTPANVGPAWRKACKPERSDFARVLELDFAHLLPSHGTPIVNTAKQEVAATLNRLF